MQRPRTFRRWSVAMTWMVVACSTYALTGSIARGDRLTLLASDQAAARARFDLIRSARREIDLAYFIVGEDRFSRTMLDALARAARRGVRVRMVIDGFGTALSLQTQQWLTSSGVQLREYHQPRLLQPESITNRLHDKYLARDGMEMIVGGRNLANTYFGRAPAGQRNFVDVDLRITGKLVRASQYYFDALWRSSAVRPVLAVPLSRSPPQLMNALRQHLTPLTLFAGPVNVSLSDAEPVFAPLEVDPHQLQFVYDSARYKTERTGVADALCRLLDSARRSVVLETPYFVPEGRLDRALLAALQRGVRVIILTNSLATTDHQVVYPAYHDCLTRYLKNGAEMWEYRGPDVLHAKTLVIDQRVAAVTSFNFDPRSAKLDTQTGVIVYDRRFANQVLRAAQPHFDAAVRIRSLATESSNAPNNSSSANLGPLRLEALRLVSRAIVPHL